jgi:predicted nuclease of predicted toxin-antitoxin system
MRRNWQPVPKRPVDEAAFRREPISEAGGLLRDLFPDSESALRNGLAGAGDFRILTHASERDFVLVSTDSDFEGILGRVPGAKVVILRACNYPTEVAAEALRRNAIRISLLVDSADNLLVLDR